MKWSEIYGNKRNYKEDMIPELLKMLEYTKENLENIFNEKDEFYGYIYAFFLLAEFREKRAFPYLIDST